MAKRYFDAEHPAGQGERDAMPIVVLPSSNKAIRFLTNGDTTKVAAGPFLPGHDSLRRAGEFMARHDGIWPTPEEQHALEMDGKRRAFQQGLPLSEDPESPQSRN
ncbi:MAG TPA: hypothetical protein VN711_03760 [Candidatus Saccharimonadales bacterium]|nr:hypothetical protein [Candidatus Saccharimonadales bacterium]